MCTSNYRSFNQTWTIAIQTYFWKLIIIIEASFARTRQRLRVQCLKCYRTKKMKEKHNLRELNFVESERNKTWRIETQRQKLPSRWKRNER